MAAAYMHDPLVSVGEAVRSVVATAERNSPAHDALVAIAYALATKLDEGAGMATAAVAAELRATLSELLAKEGEDDEYAGFLAGLSSPVGDAAKP
jgi:hypothetical protein